MCSAPSAPSIPEPKPLPMPAPLPAPQAPAPPPPVAPAPKAPTVPATPPPKSQGPAPTPPPPALVDGMDETPAVKKRKSKRKVLQQQSKGTSVLKIPLNTGSGGKGKSAGLNIPTES